MTHIAIRDNFMDTTLTATKERPILFSGPMVRAILEGRKTQTRRVITDYIGANVDSFEPCEDGWHSVGDLGMCNGVRGLLGHYKCPYGQPGDRLWVRETWGVGCRPDPNEGWRDGIEYRADEEYDYCPLYSLDAPGGWDYSEQREGWHPSIHMPRWMSRITLEVIGVRVERVQDICLADIKREGVQPPGSGWPSWHEAETMDGALAEHYLGCARYWFRDLWDGINAKRGYGWDANPWVWVVEFKRL